MSFENQRADLLEAVFNLGSLIEKTSDPAKISEYIHQLQELKERLRRLGPAPETESNKTHLSRYTGVRSGDDNGAN